MMEMAREDDAPLLLVEDDAEVLQAMVEVIEDSGIPVVSTSNGLEALRYLETANPLPRVILLDLMMPIMDGFQFRQAQLRDPRWAGIPVVVLTALPRLDKRAAELGDYQLLMKPVRLEVLEHLLAQYFPQLSG